MDGSSALKTESRPVRAEELQETLRECAFLSEALLNLLREEQTLLKRFASDEIVQILPQKEFLVDELSGSLQRFLRMKEAAGGSPKGSEAIELKTNLMQIEEMNERNRVFIEGSLNFWQDFLGLLRPAMYGADECSRPVAIKGLAFSREV